MQLGDFFQQSRMEEKAMRTYQELIQLQPQSGWAAEGQFRVALLLKREKRWAEAIEEVEKVIRNYPKSHLFADAHIEAGDLYLLIKDYPKAVERYAWVLQNSSQPLLWRRASL